MKLLAEIIEIKSTAIFSVMIALFSTINIDFAFKLIGFIIYVGYQLQRWYIMHDEWKTNKKNRKP